MTSRSTTLFSSITEEDNRIRTVVLTAGTLGSRRHINLPGVHVNLPALTEKDLADVALGVELGVDFVALSFARKKEDLEELRQVLQKSGSTAQVVAKIESQSAVREIDDLGIECPMEELPIIQRRIVKRCLRLGKPVVVGRSDDRAPRRMTATMANQIHDSSTRCFKSFFARAFSRLRSL
jgi:pyruvate kinase